ncbi:Protein MB21D2 [Papilio machaon]|uniref:Protein MB21D2 n=1 Tax=Papilio machaon TaxID=76193 RepID=A0A194RCR4_PAPMA|nr:Protein MB21D2 [Papilio machaon]
MGNTKSKKVQKEPDKFFERERWKEQKREEKKKKYANPANKRIGVKEPPLNPASVLTAPAQVPPPAPAPANVRSYDDEAIDRMRQQLHTDSDAFLLNNILMCVQFFENYEREVYHVKNNPINEREHTMDEEMVRRHKHVFFADRLQECVQEHVSYQRRRDHSEPLIAPRLFIIYDNVEASEPGDTSDYCAVLDAPFYKLRIEDCKESGFVKLKKLEVLESSLSKENEAMQQQQNHSDTCSIYTDSEKESNDSDDSPYVSKGEILLQNIKLKINEVQGDSYETKTDNLTLHMNAQEITGRRPSGPTKQVSLQVQKSNISNIDMIRKGTSKLPEDAIYDEDHGIIEDVENRPRKSILKNGRRASETIHDLKSKTRFSESRAVSVDNVGADDTETSGYRSNCSSRHNESSETDSDYGYSTITESTTPKKVELSLQPKFTTSGVLPEECWVSVDLRTLDWSDDEDEVATNSSRLSLSRNLFETHHYLSSVNFMNNFVDNFIVSLGSGLGFSQEAINNALTQGASIYCDAAKNGSKLSYEVFPALLAAWPNAANQWIIRERKIIQNPRTNFSYQWPTKYMVRKAIGFGCLLVPIGFRPKRGINPDQKLQWRITFPAAERYLESCLAHSHMRCYLFALALHKTFMENETSKIGIDASHIKNHLFWQCEDNYAKWPEDRLGESLRLFLRSFYVHFGQSRFPNYFIENCNDFKSIPKPLLLKSQRKLADILESPVMHVLNALDKLRYNKKEFYPTFNVRRLYDILTCKNPLHILNPNIPETIPHYNDSSDSEDDHSNFWDKAKAHDKHYQWKKERQRQLKERRKANVNNKKRSGHKDEREINKNIILPAKMQPERRRLVLEFFIPHFIAMARSSEKFEAIKQAVIYLEQAQRLCRLLLEEPAGDVTANEYLDVIREKLIDCQRKLAKQVGYKLPPRVESYSDRSSNSHLIRKHRPKYEHMINQDSPCDSPSIAPFTFVDVHVENAKNKDFKKLKVAVDPEESKL